MYLWMKITCSIYKRLWVRSSNEHVEHIKQHVLTGTQHNNFISTKNYVIPSLVAMPHSLNVIPKQRQMANTISCSMSHHKFTSKGVHNKEPSSLSPSTQIRKTSERIIDCHGEKCSKFVETFQALQVSTFFFHSV